MPRHHARPTRRRNIYVGLALVGASVVAASCGGATTTASPLAPTVSIGSTTADAGIEGILTAAIQDEYHAEATYQRVMSEHGSVLPFVNVVQAEQRHAASIAELFVARGLTPPARAWTVDNAPSFRSVPEACAAAAQAEIENIALYDGFLAGDLAADVRTVFTNNRAASLNNHLPAFTACR